MLPILIIECSLSGAFCWNLTRWSKKHRLWSGTDRSTVSASSDPTGAGEDEDKISAPDEDVRTQRCVQGAPSLSELCVPAAKETCLRRSVSFCLAETQVRKRPDEEKELRGWALSLQTTPSVSHFSGTWIMRGD